ncbi:hypothetical protein ACFWRT_36885 [Streptomyces cyaneofuscatus]|uniref:hypothetical protein n=1 Tax=Streptomyces cyaneofuscatus TaxID=66883 RepID=UPI003651B1AB
MTVEDTEVAPAFATRVELVVTPWMSPVGIQSVQGPSAAESKYSKLSTLLGRMS